MGQISMKNLSPPGSNLNRNLQFPDCKFVSGGNSHEVSHDRLKFASVFPDIVAGVEVVRLIDRDDHAPTDIADLRSRGIRVLSLRNIESYLYDDEVIRKLYKMEGREADGQAALEKKGQLITASVARGNPPDDVKKAADQICAYVRRDLRLTGRGNDQAAFARECLAPLLEPGMAIYDRLKADIFGP